MIYIIHIISLLRLVNSEQRTLWTDIDGLHDKRIASALIPDIRTDKRKISQTSRSQCSGFDFSFSFSFFSILFLNLGSIECSEYIVSCQIMYNYCFSIFGFTELIQIYIYLYKYIYIQIYTFVKIIRTYLEGKGGVESKEGVERIQKTENRKQGQIYKKKRKEKKKKKTGRTKYMTELMSKGLVE